MFGGLIWNYISYLSETKEKFGTTNISDREKQNEKDEKLLQRVRLLELAGVRQYIVSNAENDNFEQLTVVEGKVINGFAEPLSFIELEATLYDADNNILDKKTQMAGPKINFFQLQTLGELEFEEALHDNMVILENNTQIKPGESVPFTFIFYNPSKKAANYNVKITDAQIPE